MCRFRETTFELLGGVTELNFNKLNWGVDEAVQLAVVLPVCAKRPELKLMSTQLGDKGAAALAGAATTASSPASTTWPPGRKYSGYGTKP